MNRDNESEVGALCCVCSSFLLLIACAICFLVFGIMFLVQDWDAYTSCSGSSIGPYVIVALVLTWGNSNAARSNKEGSSVIELILSLLVCFLLNTGLAIWGGIELWDKSCDDLRNTNLWRFSLAIFILQVISATTALLISFIFACISINESRNALPEATTNVYTVSRD